jgi:hypothetical protein
MRRVKLALEPRIARLSPASTRGGPGAQQPKGWERYVRKGSRSTGRSFTIAEPGSSVARGAPCYNEAHTLRRLSCGWKECRATRWSLHRASSSFPDAANRRLNEGYSRRSFDRFFITIRSAHQSKGAAFRSIWFYIYAIDSHGRRTKKSQSLGFLGRGNFDFMDFGRHCLSF